MYIPTSKIMLIKEIHFISTYTYKEIEDKYKQELNKNPKQAKYYAKKRAIRILQGWLISLIKEKWIII